MKGFSATVDTGTRSDKTARLELENGEIITVYDGKMRLEGADGERYKIKCVASIDSMTVENERTDISDENGIRRESEDSLTVLVVGKITDNDARRKWMNSEGKPLTEVDTGMGQVALKRDTMPAMNDYKIEEGDRVKAFCNRFTIIDAKMIGS